MTADLEALVRIDEEINAAENSGDADALRRHLAPAIAFRRAKSGEVVDRDAFLKSVKAGGSRVIDLRSVTLLGSHRAPVICDIAMPGGGETKHYDNARQFVRVGAEWKLLGWANEPV